MQNNIEIEDTYPLLPSQSGFLVDSLAGEEDLYRQQICVEISTSISTDTLISNIEKLVTNNKILRTIFDWSEGEPIQVVISGLPPVISRFNTKNKELTVILADEKAALPPVSDAPPIRFALIQDSAKLVLVVTYHHILLDGPSVSLFLEQVITGNFVPETDASAYTDWLDTHIGKQEYAAWRKMLVGLAKHDGALSGIVTEGSISRHTVKLGSVFYDKLLARAKELRITPATYVHTLWSEWALGYFYKDSLLFGLVTSTRIPDLSESALGPYISTVPWLAHTSSESFDATARQTGEKLLDITQAKHISLGDIARHTSPFALSFDAILTITTSPIGGGSLYKVLETYENTGYKLSVDIEIKSSDLNIMFSTLIPEAADAIESFKNYCHRQVDSHIKLQTNSHYNSYINVTAPTKTPRGNSSKNMQILTAHIATVFDLAKTSIPTSSSFLELGGDSILALRLKSLLKADSLEVSIGDILQSESIDQLATKIDTPIQTSVPVATKDTGLLASAKATQGNAVEDATLIPPAAQAIVNAYRSGYGQDYHEQAAFCLAGQLDTVALAAALNKLAFECPTLRLVYPESQSNMQVLTPTPRTSLETKTDTMQSFSLFVDTASQADWNKPIDINEGPHLRIQACQSSKDWFLFISFSALVTDGWSFSNMLERLFVIYDQVLKGSYTPKTIDAYMEHSAKTNTAPIATTFDKPTNGYSSQVSGEDFVINKQLMASLALASKKARHTISSQLLSITMEALKPEGFSQIEVYENGRDDPNLFESIGPYSVLSPRVISRSSHKSAYYVFENYPRQSENNLKDGRLKHFKESGNWRRDLLPPNINLGFMFEEQNQTIKVRILTREDKSGHYDSKFYWKLLLKVIKGE